MTAKRWVNNLFTKIRYNKIFFKYGNLNPIWLNLGKNQALLDAYYSIPELSAVINYGAEAFSNGIWKYINNKGEEEPDHRSLILLNNPNPVQNGKELLKDFHVYKSVFGNAFIYKLYPEGRKPIIDNIACLYNIPSQLMKINMSGRLFQQSDISEIIDNYSFADIDEPFAVSDILLKNDIGIKYRNGQYVLGQSRFIGLSKALSNIIAAYEARNVLITRRGAIGAWVNASKDATGGTWPLNKDDKTELLKEFQETYGLSGGKAQIMIANKDLRWEGNTFDNRRLQLLEETEQDFYKICDTYGTPKELFSNTKGSTFTNKDSAERSFYRNTIIPKAEDLANSLTGFLFLDKGKLILDYSHLEILQEDEKIKAERNNKNAMTILSIQKSVKDGSTSEISAIQILIYLFSISEEKAKLLLL